MTLEKFPFTPILGWSISRYDLFSMCKRQYFYNYYTKYDNEYNSEELNDLKNLTSIPLIVGTITHEVIKILLERIQVDNSNIDPNRFFSYVKNLTHKTIQNEKFFEVYYEDIDEVNSENIFQSIESNLNNFLNSDRYGWIREKASENKKEWIIEPKGFGETRIEGWKAYTKVDFLFPLDGKVFILDWKTGKEDEKKHQSQMKGYTLWALNNFDVPISNITTILSYLNPVYREEEYIFTQDELSDFTSRISSETKLMYEFLVDIENNIPIPKEKFPKTHNSNICKYCNFKKFCLSEFEF